MFGMKKRDKESVGLLCTGTFLEYFDLMLYVHMAVLLNSLFFPKTDPKTEDLLTALAFCSTYILRPFGALIFGWIGDNFGRKITVVITTTMMSFSCLVMANLSTYAEIGITASYIVTICRIVQGMSSMGEISGAQLYLCETIKPPSRYPAVAMLALAVSIGTSAALGMASLVTSYNFNWRTAFLAGALIAIVGAMARTKLRETPDFADAKRRIKNKIANSEIVNISIDQNPIIKEKVDLKTTLAVFLMDCMWPMCFYFAYFHCKNVLKNNFGYTPEEIIHQNFIVSIIQLASLVTFVAFSYRIYPLIILKIKLCFSMFIFIITPFALEFSPNGNYILILQCCIVFFACDVAPATSVFYKYFPVFKRFTYISTTYALSRAVTYVITSFGFVYLEMIFGNWGVLVLMFPIIILYFIGLRYFEKLEKKFDHA